MSNMNGNPHAEDAARYVNEASSLHDWPNSERPIIAANAQALATLALAYEQRTANLIAKLAFNTQVATGGVGLNKPRQINNYSELAALPYGSAVLTSDISDTVVLRSDRDDFMNQSGYTIPARTLWDYGSKPLTVLWEPLP